MSIGGDKLVDDLLDQAASTDECLIAFTDTAADAERWGARLQSGARSRRIDLEHPRFGFNPLAAGGSADILAADLADVVLALAADDSPDPGARIRLRDAISMTIEAWRKGDGEPLPSFRAVAAELQSFDASGSVQGALASLGGDQIERILRHPVQVPVDDLVRPDQTILIAAGSGGSKPGHGAVQPAVAGLLIGGSRRSASLPVAQGHRVDSRDAPTSAAVLAADPNDAALSAALCRLGRRMGVEVCSLTAAERRRVRSPHPAGAPAAAASHSTRQRGQRPESGVQREETAVASHGRERLRTSNRVPGSGVANPERELLHELDQQALFEDERRRRERERIAVAMAGAFARRRSRRQQKAPRRVQINAQTTAAAVIALTLTIVVIAVLTLAGGMAAVEQRQNQSSPWSSIWHLLFPKPLSPGEETPGKQSPLEPGESPPIAPDEPAPVEEPLPVEIPILELVAQVTPNGGIEIPSSLWPVFNEAARVFDVNAYLLASVAEQESSFGAGTAWMTPNVDDCVGFMQACIGGKGGDSWDGAVTLTGHPAATFPDRCAWTFDTTLAGGAQAGSCPPDSAYNDPVHAVMAAAAELRSKVGGVPIPNLTDGTAHIALCRYYGACSDPSANYAYDVLSRAQTWEAQGGNSEAEITTGDATLDASTSGAPTSTLEGALQTVTAAELANLTTSQLASGLNDLDAVLHGASGPMIVETSVVTGSSAVAAPALAYALAQLGKPYLYGAAGPSAFDCSGLTLMAYRKAGITLPHNAQAQYDAGPVLPNGAPLQPGDLAYFGSSTSDIGHVGIVLTVLDDDDAEMVDAPNSKSVVRIDTFQTRPGAPWGSEDFVGATRPAAAVPQAAVTA